MRWPCIVFAAVSLIPMYFGAVWYVWPCRQLDLGRELREAKSIMLKPRGHSEAPCAERPRTKLFMEISSEGSFVAEAQRHGDVQAPPQFPGACGTAPCPWSDAEWQDALKKGAAYASYL